MPGAGRRAAGAHSARQLRIPYLRSLRAFVRIHPRPPPRAPRPRAPPTTRAHIISRLLPQRHSALELSPMPESLRAKHKSLTFRQAGQFLLKLADKNFQTKP